MENENNLFNLLTLSVSMVMVILERRRVHKAYTFSLIILHIMYLGTTIEDACYPF